MGNNRGQALLECRNLEIGVAARSLVRGLNLE